MLSKLSVAKWCHMMTYSWVNIGSGNGLFPDDTKPILEPMLRFCYIHMWAISLEIFKICVLLVNNNLSWNIWFQCESTVQCLPFYIINEGGHLTTSVDHLAEFCQNYHLAAICTQLMVEFFLQLRFIQYFDCKCMKIPDFSRIDSHFVA